MDEADKLVRRALGETLEAARAGDGRALFVRASLLSRTTELLRRARSLAAEGSAIAVVAVRGSVLERDLPFAFAEQLTGSSDGGLLSASPLVATARRLLDGWSAAGPTVLLLDDVQWADDASLELLALLTRRLAGRPVALVATLRGWPPAAAALADELARERSVTVIELPMVVAAVATLPSRELLARAFAGLPEHARACAEAAAVLLATPAADGTAVPLPSADLRAVAESDAAEFAAVLDLLVAAGLLRADGGTVRFALPALAAAIDGTLAPGRRALLHGRAYERLRERGDVVAAAPHAVAAGAVGDPRAVETIARAAEAVFGGSAERGLELFAAAVELAEPTPPPALLARFGDALFAAGRPDEALARYTRLLRLPLDLEGRAGALLRAARAQTYTGRFEDGRASYDDLVAQAREQGSGPSAALLLERAHVVWELGGPLAGVEALAPELAPAAGAAERELLEAARGQYLLQAGDPSGVSAIERFADRERRRLGAGSDDPAASFNAALLQAACCCITERFDAGAAAIEHGSATLRDAGAVRAAAPLLLIAVGAQLHRGDPGGALEELERIEAELDVDPLMRPHLLMLRARARQLLGLTSEAADSARAAAALPAAGSFFVRIWLTWVEAEGLLAAGRAAEAAGAFGELFATVRAVGLREPCVVPWAAGAIEAALAAGELALAAELCDWLEEAAAPLPCRWPRAVALAGRAGLAAAAGDD
ncbi:AAA family ATPase, partial [Conexibacter stalactiti]